jgi:hypothetical protein
VQVANGRCEHTTGAWCGWVYSVALLSPNPTLIPIPGLPL